MTIQLSSFLLNYMLSFHTFPTKKPQHDDHSNIIIPLELHGVTSHFPNRTPTLDEPYVLNPIYLINNSPDCWDPYVLLLGSLCFPFAKQEYSITNTSRCICNQRDHTKQPRGCFHILFKHSLLCIHQNKVMAVLIRHYCSHY